MTILLQPIRFHTPVDPEHYTVDNRPLEDIADNLQTIIDALNALNWVNIPFDITFPANGETFSYSDGFWRNVEGGVDATTVNNLISTKIDATTVNTLLSTKADTTTVNTLLSTKIDTTTVNTLLSTKIDTTTVNTLLSTKANTTFAITNSSATDYTVILTDEYIRRNSSSANNTTIPLNNAVAFPIGYTVHIRQVGTGQSTIVATPGVTILTPETLKLRKIGAIVSLTKVDTNTWEIYGDLESA